MESLKEIIDQAWWVIPIVVISGNMYIARRMVRSLRPIEISVGMEILAGNKYDPSSRSKITKPFLVMSYKDEYNKNKDIYYCEHQEKRFLLKKFIGFREPTTEELVEIQNRVEEAKKVYKEGPEKFQEYVAKHYLKAQTKKKLLN